MVDRRMLLVIALLGTVAACGRHHGTDNPGPQVSRNYQVAGFDKLIVAGPYDVDVISDGKPGVEAVGGSNLLDQTEVVIDDGALQIRPKQHHGWSWGHWGDWNGSHGNGHAHFTVHGGLLKETVLAGSGDVKVDRTAPDYEGTVAGSGNLAIAAADAQKIKLSVAGSGDVEASGKTVAGDYSIAGSGDMKLAGLQADTIEANIVGSGSIAAHAAKTAAISIMGSGDVDVTGGAKCTVSKTGSGSANCH